MIARRAVVALFAIQMAAAVALAQETSEFGRASGGQIDVFTKRPQRLSGSLGLSLSGPGHGFGATAGGTIIPDRLWFFGSAQQSSWTAARMNTTLNDRHDLTASFNQNSAIPSSFLSLHYTGIVSSNSFFNVSVSRSK